MLHELVLRVGDFGAAGWWFVWCCWLLSFVLFCCGFVYCRGHPVSFDTLCPFHPFSSSLCWLAALAGVQKTEIFAGENSALNCRLKKREILPLSTRASKFSAKISPDIEILSIFMYQALKSCYRTFRANSILLSIRHYTEHHNIFVKFTVAVSKINILFILWTVKFECCKNWMP